ncbi:GPCR protein, PTH11-type [Xylaria sp. CBS 124048]|nr:GPCR protein, PTH11-type [Xylaria sp. CBS 124048]
MSLYSPPPPLHTPDSDKPTLLVCWWITLFCATIIFLRVGGRFVRSEKLFREDKTAIFAVIPLFLRMGLVHVVLLWGTNNARFTWPLTETEIRHKSVASGLVIGSRILYPATLWILKLAILEFFTRLTSTSWRRAHEVTLIIIRCTLIITFIAVVIANLAECQPFNHYWQVLPDPGGRCRQGYVQLITMVASNIVTDLILVIFPVPIILASHLGTTKKIQLTLLFCLSLGPIGTTIYRVVYVFRNHGSQQTRSLIASVELLFATMAANALILGSFVRDRGTKKIKYRTSLVDPLGRATTRRPTIHKHWGSDEDLVRDMGLGLNRGYHDEEEETSDLRFGAAIATLNHLQSDQHLATSPAHTHGDNANHHDRHGQPASPGQSRPPTSPKHVSFLDPGGLLLDADTSEATLQSTRDSYNSSLDPLSYRATPSPTVTASDSGLRRGSQTLLQDLSSLFNPFQQRQARALRGGTELRTIPRDIQESAYETDEYGDLPALIDAGGLLR